MDHKQDPKDNEEEKTDTPESTGKTTDDQEVGWMLRFKSGDQYGFLKILQRYEKPVINFSYKFLRNREAAEDVAQEVFLSVHQRASSYEPKGKLSTWIFTMARNRCVDVARRKKILSFFSLDKPVESEDKEVLREFPDPVENNPPLDIEKKDRDMAVRAAIARLPSHQKTIVLLAKFEGMELEQIAEIMNISVGAVKQLLHRAKRHLKEVLKGVIDTD